MLKEENEGGGMSEETKHECFCQGAGPALTDFLKKMGPPEAARQHFDHARVEFLKGLRALLDARIESIAKEPPQGAKITVE
jgi:hypothetical protein